MQNSVRGDARGERQYEDERVHQSLRDLLHCHCRRSPKRDGEERQQRERGGNLDHGDVHRYPHIRRLARMRSTRIGMKGRGCERRLPLLVGDDEKSGAWEQ
jgi:hypothetical protein